MISTHRLTRRTLHCADTPIDLLLMGPGQAPHSSRCLHLLKRFAHCVGWFNLVSSIELVKTLDLVDLAFTGTNSSARLLNLQPIFTLGNSAQRQFLCQKTFEQVALSFRFGSEPSQNAGLGQFYGPAQYVHAR